MKTEMEMKIGNLRTEMKMSSGKLVNGETERGGHECGQVEKRN